MPEYYDKKDTEFLISTLSENFHFPSSGYLKFNQSEIASEMQILNPKRVRGSCELFTIYSEFYSMPDTGLEC